VVPQTPDNLGDVVERYDHVGAQVPETLRVEGAKRPPRLTDPDHVARLVGRELTAASQSTPAADKGQVFPQSWW
jgi:hypothetical protein